MPHTEDSLDESVDDDAGLSPPYVPEPIPFDDDDVEAEAHPPPPTDGRTHVLEVIRALGLFDVDFYLRNSPDLERSALDPLEHFFVQGFRESRLPNFYFDPLWYLQVHPDVASAGMQPLSHYALHGDSEDRRPSKWFDTSWYRRTYGVPPGENALAHYLARRTTGEVSPHPDFDVRYYLDTYPDVASAGIDPFEHFVLYGYSEGRNPSDAFDTRYYRAKYLGNDPDVHPFLHYVEHKGEPWIHGRPPANETTAARELKRFSKPSSSFEEVRPLSSAAIRRAKVLAYYLPQFHAFPENDAWWGNGFTEWTNVARGTPRFEGHYQPRIPRDLGFYNLDTLEPMRRQVDMARAGGIHGFVFYFYWFNGKRLMDGPTDRFLADPTVDFPFSLMWANENWTRRWDGEEQDVLISQDYLDSDDERMAEEFVRHFKDPRYIRLEGRPLLMIYRVGLIPQAAKTIDRWRRIFRDLGEEPLLVMAQSFGDNDPTRYGLDGAIEFPPHKLTQSGPTLNDTVKYVDPDFDGRIYDYDAIVRTSLDEPPPTFPLIKTVVPSWDNDARRQGTGVVLHGSTPASYEGWLSELVSRAVAKPFFGEPLVCVNAWNEWCEGAYLEPDIHFGAAYLNATARAVTTVTSSSDDTPRIILVGHDAFPSGAQQLLLHIARTLRNRFGFTLEILLLGAGKLEAAYAEIAPTAVVGDVRTLSAKVEALAARGFRSAIVNTTASASALAPLRAAGVTAVSLIHELPQLIREKNLGRDALSVVEHASTIVFAVPHVRDRFFAEVGAEMDDRTRILPQGIYKEVTRSESGRESIRASLGIGVDDVLVLGAGYGDLRKGVDLLLQVWRTLVRASERRIHVAWLGNLDPTLRSWLEGEIDAATATGTFHLMGFRDDVASCLAAADVFALTSREDPFPTVALESLAVGVPVVAFEGAGGIPDLLRDPVLGEAVPYGDTFAMSEAIVRRSTTTDDAERTRRIAFATSRFSFPQYVRSLVGLACPGLARVSVAIPSYNYARYMADRLRSVLHQTHPVDEVLVLDDVSKDDSVAVARATARDAEREVRIFVNERNSGSVFSQWRKAAEIATGDFLWIAEADDLADPSFLAATLAEMRRDPSIVLSFTDSRSIDVHGQLIEPSYKGYYATLGSDALARSEVFEARAFVRDYLAVKNVILNVSSVVWRRDALLRALDACADELRTFKMAGDWLLYLQALSTKRAKIYYHAGALNVHRRHASSVTHSLDVERHLDEIRRCQAHATGKVNVHSSTQSLQKIYIEDARRHLLGL